MSDHYDRYNGMEELLGTNLAEVGTDSISRRAAIEVVQNRHMMPSKEKVLLINDLEKLPSAQPTFDARDTQYNLPIGTDLISRQAAVDRIRGTGYADQIKENVIMILMGVPSVQPERTCVNCGRTLNNGGWYADGGTRCPIEEHYALPKDGYCHLWEKRNVTDDDYPERRTDE